MRTKHIGERVPRREGGLKVSGRARYVDDWTLTGALYGVTVRSPVARGIIRQIGYPAGTPWEQFTIVTAADIPGSNSVANLEKDQPFLAVDRVQHAEQAILLLAHPNKSLLEKARRAVSLDIEHLPAVLSLESSLAQEQVVWGHNNVFKELKIEKGNVDGVLNNAPVIVEGEYWTGAQEQLYLETNGMIAVANPKEGVTVWGSMQCPYFVHKALMELFSLPMEKVRVVQMETGGAFGGKEDYPSVLAGHAALLAWKSGKPVKMVYDRGEDMAATTKRHPSRTQHRTVVDRNGKLLAMDIDFAIDGGGHMTLSPIVLSRGSIHAAGPYYCPNIRIHGRAVATNTPPHGAFRGFGAPQSLFALERHMDKVARTVGLSPVEFRRRNFIRQGESTATGQRIRESIQMEKLLHRALKETNYEKKVRLFAKQNLKAKVKKGMGVSCFFHGAGFTGSGEKRLASVVAVEATEQGKLRVLASITELGQGAVTIFTQIAADALGISGQDIEVAQADTAFVPDSGPTVASRTCMIVGKILESACIELKQTLIQNGLLKERYTSNAFRAACKKYVKQHGQLKSFAQYQQPSHIQWDDEKHEGDAYGTMAWAIYIAEVSVDLSTYEIRVDDFLALQEIGKVMNPLLAEGQIIGGVVQGIGYTLHENVIWNKGRMVNNRITDYIIPTSMDVPPVRVIFEENPYEFGPSGAKGIGELPLDGVAPAIVNAIESATGAAINRIPVTPEVLLEAMENTNE
ncbi:MAG: xanthine dehydrogenase family protein [Deltaproteobacteria bacterium]|nr:xanthine dehydrogenase family protein [Deltaproteobacteria bacterium]